MSASVTAWVQELPERAPLAEADQAVMRRHDLAHLGVVEPRGALHAGMFVSGAGGP